MRICRTPRAHVLRTWRVLYDMIYDMINQMSTALVSTCRHALAIHCLICFHETFSHVCHQIPTYCCCIHVLPLSCSYFFFIFETFSDISNQMPTRHCCINVVPFHRWCQPWKNIVTLSGPPPCPPPTARLPPNLFCRPPLLQPPPYPSPSPPFLSPPTSPLPASPPNCIVKSFFPALSCPQTHTHTLSLTKLMTKW